MIIGMFIGHKLLKVDRDTAYLISRVLQFVGEALLLLWVLY